MSNSNEIRPGSGIANLGAPIRIAGLHIDGVASEHRRPEEAARLWTRLIITSDDVNFHRIVRGLVSVVESRAQEFGKSIELDRANIALIVIYPNGEADLWLDTAATSLNIMAKRDFQPGSPIFEYDIADIIGMDFPAVDIPLDARVICLFRRNWSFALLLDLNNSKSFDRTAMVRDLGTMYRLLNYKHLYESISNPATFGELISRGWFPFVEIQTEYPELAIGVDAGFDLENIEESILKKFDESRLDRLLARWMAKPMIATKESLVRAALSAFKANEPVAVIKIILTEIEGVIGAAYRTVHGKSAKTKTLLAFAVQSAEHKTGGTNTLLFPTAFAQYLSSHTFADFDPRGGSGEAGSRHAVGHGVAAAESYTMIKALQALLTLDQICFYL